MYKTVREAQWNGGQALLNSKMSEHPLTSWVLILSWKPPCWTPAATRIGTSPDLGTPPGTLLENPFISPWSGKPRIISAWFSVWLGHAWSKNRCTPSYRSFHGGKLMITGGGKFRIWKELNRSLILIGCPSRAFWNSVCCLPQTQCQKPLFHATHFVIPFTDYVLHFYDSILIKQPIKWYRMYI